MKVIIIMLILVSVVMLVIFVIGLVGAAATRSAWEQMLEDEDQKAYIDRWMERKRASRNVPDQVGHGIVHTVESENKSGRFENKRGLSGQKE